MRMMVTTRASQLNSEEQARRIVSQIRCVQTVMGVPVQCGRFGQGPRSCNDFICNPIPSGISDEPFGQPFLKLHPVDVLIVLVTQKESCPARGEILREFRRVY